MLLRYQSKANYEGNVHTEGCKVRLIDSKKKNFCFIKIMGQGKSCSDYADTHHYYLIPSWFHNSHCSLPHLHCSDLQVSWETNAV
jgi:hypothetical protein